MKAVSSLLILIPSLFLSTLLGQDSPPDEFAPANVAADDFQALKGQSPFLRSLNMSDSLVLTGFADVEGERVATLVNKETKQTYVVSSQTNSQGWKMVDLKTNEDLEKVSVKVAIDGGEVVTVRYAEVGLKAGEAKPAPGPSTEPNGGPTSIIAAQRSRFGGPGGPDGRRFGGGPPPEIREKLDKLSDEQRDKLREKMRELHEKSPDMSWEDRGKLFNDTLDKMLKKNK
ncbi:MAG: hypothetical protein KDN18_16190 [Verrucomicrobiae bacterium]|nr:hypothetical protein [Verrucomicrobiae bacterium]